MSFTMNFWKVKGNNLKEIQKSKLDSEKRLEDWIEKDTTILGLDLLLIGRQVQTDFGGKIDLLAVNSLAEVVVIELKKDKTPRDVVAQILDYASWIKDLSYNELNSISVKYKNLSLSELFNKHFGSNLPENVNTNHSMILVSSELDDSSERIIQYLTKEYKVNINAIFFNFYKDKESEYLGRAWLLDPENVQEMAESRKQAPWLGYWFVNVGEGPHRNWDDNKKYKYIGAGQGLKYSKPLTKLKVDDKIFAYMKSTGYVGYGIVTEPVKIISEFIVKSDGKPLLGHKLKAQVPKDNIDDPDRAEYTVGIDWKKTTNRENAKTFKGVFANQNVVCKLRDKTTVEFLEREFGL